MTTISYEVHYKCYQYNTGSANNGHYTAKETFSKETEARGFIEKVNTDSNFRNELVEDGYFCKVEKLICIAKHELFLEKQLDFENMPIAYNEEWQ